MFIGHWSLIIGHCSSWALQDLNLGPTDYESAALTAELRARIAPTGPRRVGISNYQCPMTNDQWPMIIPRSRIWVSSGVIWVGSLAGRRAKMACGELWAGESAGGLRGDGVPRGVSGAPPPPPSQSCAAVGPETPLDIRGPRA